MEKCLWLLVSYKETGYLLYVNTGFYNFHLKLPTEDQIWNENRTGNIFRKFLNSSVISVTHHVHEKEFFPVKQSSLG